MKKLSGSSAIYLQIQHYFETEIASGRLSPGTKIDSIRALAVEFSVNPNTIQKSLLELERDDLLVTDRTNGKFVTEDENIIKALKIKLEKDLVQNFVRQSQSLGIEKNKIIEIINESWEEN
ncbi:MAG: GntR family transcriptional regulator [Erysipelothrix sp.]|nr:GntR family transcriptional regulator [Erysipelothrix sp.]